MPTVPIKESGDNFGHKDANVPFAIEDAVVSSGDLDITIGDGRIAWGGTTYELSTAGVGTTVSELSIPAAVDNYYVYIDFNSGTPQLIISTTAPSGISSGKFEPLGYVTTTATPTVDSITDLRGMLPQSSFFKGVGGTAADPTYSFAADPDTGIYNAGADDVGIALGGTLNYLFAGGDFTMRGGGQILAEDGAQTAPSLSFESTADAGMYWDSANSGVGIAVSGNRELLIQSANLVTGVRWRGPDGSEGFPAISFQSDTDTGFYQPSAGEIGVTLEGSTVATFDGGGLGAREILTFTSSGTFSKGSYPWCRLVRYRVQGAGGGSGGADNIDSGDAESGGSGGGGYVEGFILASSLSASETVTVGAGGANGTASSNGSTGGDSSFGSHGTGSGGGGSPFATATTGFAIYNKGTGGGTSGGEWSIDGQDGCKGVVRGGDAQYVSRGGSSYLGQAGTSNNATSSTSAAPKGYGAGVAGAVAVPGSGRLGADGGDGIVILELYA